MPKSDYTKYGDFNDSGREFIITRQDCPKLWNNYAWNRLIYVMVDQRGRGETMYRSPEGDRTYLLKDRTVYVKDRDSGEFWTIGWDPVRLDFSHYRCCHGLGYTRLEMNNAGIESTWTLTSAVDAPIEMWRVKVRNASDRKRRLSVYPYGEFDLRGFYVYCNMENTILTEVADDARTIYAWNKDDGRPGAKNSAFMATDRDPVAFQTGKRPFMGSIYGSLADPAQIKDERLPSFVDANEDLIGCFQFDVELDPGAEAEYYVILGPFMTRQDGDELRDQWLDRTRFDGQLAGQAARTEIYGRVDFTVPDDYMQKWLNIWIKQNLFFQGDFNRGWSMGFRDTCQDSQAICPYNPKMTRALLAETMSHLHQDGSALRAWFPIDTHKYADSGVWLTLTLTDYIKETGDFAFLDEMVPYYDGGEGTVLEHAVRALKWIYEDPGPHGLTKIFFGDWNDNLDIGNEGKGESVWLSIALYWAHSKLIELCERIGNDEHAAFFRAEQKKLKDAIEEHCWDGKWYLRGFTDLNEKVGGHDCEEGRMFCNPQTWAIMSGLNPERNEIMEQSLQENLMQPYGLLVVYPSYSTYRKSHGRITCQPVGWGTNGASYCHVTGFKAFADTVRGDGNAALASIRSIAPNNPNNPIDISTAEPHGQTNVYNGPEHPRPGTSLRGWYTGTDAWLLRVMAERMIGAQPDYDGLRIAPVLPDEWDTVHLSRTFRDAHYEIDVTRGDVDAVQVKVDGQPIDGNLLPYEQFNGNHTVDVVIPR